MEDKKKKSKLTYKHAYLVIPQMHDKLLLLPVRENNDG